ncbi:phage-related hypothetical protein [plant metagenome]|uniref:Uncharacterized protein n=1 Tax=plant metagenome TaxID=1297885 RepID=A0A484RXI2_9ZZZZ
MTRRIWKSFRPTSLPAALRGCKDFAADRHNLSVERIADRMGVTHDALYKWLATGRMPAILIPTYELACGCNFATTWLASSAGKIVIDMPTGKRAETTDLLDVNSGCARALQLLTAFYADPTVGDTEATLAALRSHMEQVAYHHHNVARYATPELEF